MGSGRTAIVLITVLTLPCRAAAQVTDRPVRLGVVVASVTSGEFDSTDAGLGVQVAWLPSPLVGAELEVILHPADLGDPPFSSGRVETLFGVSIGPRIDRWRPFSKVRTGILRYWESPEPVSCIAIFPMPVECTLANGRTVVAFELGGGLELALTDRSFVRVDAGDRMLVFPGPVRDADGMSHQDGYFAHDLRVTSSIGIRF